MSLTISTPDSDRKSTYTRVPKGTSVATVDGGTPEGSGGSSGGEAVWGKIVGYLPDQDDLFVYLNTKLDVTTFTAAIGVINGQIAAVTGNLNAHVANTANPHAVTKTQVGLGNVDNTSDINKPVSTAQAAAIAAATGGALTITSTQITDSTAVGRSILTAATTTAAQTAMGGGSIGRSVFIAATPTAALAAIGAQAFWQTELTSTNSSSSATGAFLGVPTQPSMKNFLDNGDFSVSNQANGTVTVTNQFFMDRWRFTLSPALKASGGVVDLGATPAYGGPSNRNSAASSQVNASRFQRCARLTNLVAGAPAAGDFTAFQQGLEGVRLRMLPWGSGSTDQQRDTVLTFLARASVAGTYAVSVYSQTANRSYAQTFVVTTPNVWAFYQVGIPVDTNAAWTPAVLETTNLAALVRFCAAAGTTYQTASLLTWQNGNFLGPAAIGGATNFSSTVNATLDVTGIQWESAGGPTAFEFLPPDIQGERCMRYWQRIIMKPAALTFTANGDSRDQGIQFPVAMRITPALTAGPGVISVIGFGDAGAVTNVNITVAYNPYNEKCIFIGSPIPSYAALAPCGISCCWAANTAYSLELDATI